MRFQSGGPICHVERSASRLSWQAGMLLSPRSFIKCSCNPNHTVSREKQGHHTAGLRYLRFWGCLHWQVPGASLLVNMAIDTCQRSGWKADS